jgi:Uma2 family endonuclease
MSDSIGTPPAPPPWPEDYVPRLFTAADLAAMPSELPSGTVLYELHHGRLITMPPPGFEHAAVGLKVGAALLNLGEERGHGKATGDVGIILRRNPDHVYGADAAFIANHRLPARIAPEGYLETIPDLVVEVRSKNDTLAALARKAAEYLEAGGVVVWVADPINCNVVEHRQGAEPRTYGEDDTLTLEDIIPGFELPVRRALAR